MADNPGTNRHRRKKPFSRCVAVIFCVFIAPALLAACDRDKGRPLAPRNNDSPPAPAAQADPALQQLLKELITFGSESEIQNALDKICSELPPDAEEVSVQRIIDGDTITLSDGRLVRYVGIDASEKNFQTGTADPCFQEALSLNRQLLENRKILLVYDAEKQDRYNRTVAYVFAKPASGEGKTAFVNAELVRAGYVRAYRYAPNLKYSALMYALEEFAASQKRGMWQTVRYGFVGSNKSHKFHRLTCKYGEGMNSYNRVDFKTRREALEAGYIPCNSCRP